MQIKDIKDLMAQFDASSLTEFALRNEEGELTFSKNDCSESKVAQLPDEKLSSVALLPEANDKEAGEVALPTDNTVQAEGDIVESPLVGVAYLSPAPDKPHFVSVGDRVKKGQTLIIIEAMKVMNEVPAPKDGLVTEILVANEEVVDFGKGLVRIK